MNLRASFCDPLNPEIFELGRIPKEEVLDKFGSINWVDYLQKITQAKEEEIYFSPSFEVENTDAKQGLSISAVGDPRNFEFCIFYKRPKKVKSFFGLKEKVKGGYVSDKTGQTKQDAIDCLSALLRNDTEFLEQKIG